MVLVHKDFLTFLLLLLLQAESRNERGSRVRLMNKEFRSFRAPERRERIVYIFYVNGELVGGRRDEYGESALSARSFADHANGFITCR
jgi:hypothetical protein